VRKLVEIVNDPGRPRPLRCIGTLRYPPRGVSVKDVDDKTVFVELALIGHEYKGRFKPQNPLIVDKLKIKDCFNRSLLPEYLVAAIASSDHVIQLTIVERGKHG